MLRAMITEKRTFVNVLCLGVIVSNVTFYCLVMKNEVERAQIASTQCFGMSICFPKIDAD